MSSEYALRTALVPIEPVQLWYADLLERLQCISLTEAGDRRAEYEAYMVEVQSKRAASVVVSSSGKSKKQERLDREAKESSQPSSEEPSRGGTPTHESPTEADDDAYLVSLDPTESKDQDHYRVLGLAHRRHEASEDEIKRQYRRKCLKHHPDKRGKVDLDLDYFACIVKAYEQLSEPAKRRAYDSVDPTFDETVPTAAQASAAAGDWRKFSSLFSPVFSRNAHFSNIQPVPLLGDMKSTKEEVDSFYTFWYDFDSWREFSYLDEEDKERGEDREERRYIEKNNAKKRKERKKEDTTRLRSLVDLAFNNDPRIAGFKRAERERKELEKKTREQARREKEEAERKAIKEQQEAENRAKKEAEDQAKAEKEREKREKDKAKKALRESKKALENILVQNHYFIPDTQPKASGTPQIDPTQRLQAMEHSAILLQTLETPQLKDLESRISSASDWSAKKKIYREALSKVITNIEQERQAHTQKSTSATNGTANGSGDKLNEWPHEELIILIKAVNLYPAGTRDRWEVVARYLNQHYRQVQLDKGETHPERSGKDVMIMAKDLIKLDNAIKKRTNEEAKKKVGVTSNGVETSTPESVPSQRVDAPQWTAEEQKLFEEALRKFGPKEAERWDKICDHVGTRTKKECMLRFKELRDLVAKKKEQQQAAK